MKYEMITPPTFDLEVSNRSAVERIANFCKEVGIHTPPAAVIRIAQGLMRVAEKASKQYLLKQEVRLRQFKEFLRIASLISLESQIKSKDSSRRAEAEGLRGAYNMMLLIAGMDNSDDQSYFMNVVVMHYNKDPILAVVSLDHLSQNYTDVGFSRMAAYDFDRGHGLPRQN